MGVALYTQYINDFEEISAKLLQDSTPRPCIVSPKDQGAVKKKNILQAKVWTKN
jgi:hypothetical protein